MVLLALPAHNEEASLGALLDNVRAVAPHIPGLQVLLVDDGCADGTVAIAESFRDRLPLRVARHPRNLGLGAAVRTCLAEFARCGAPNDVLVTMDADNTHSPSLIPLMLEKVRGGKDIVIASRYARGADVRGVPGVRNVLSGGLRFFACAVFPIPGVRDYSCGFRAYSGRYLLPILRLHGADRLVRENGFAAMPEVLLRLYLANPAMGADEVPITLRYDLKGSPSQMKVLRNVIKVAHLFLRLSAKRVE
jgi:dolichol-phosphate mannosyltransferase